MGFAELIASAPTALVALAFGGGLLPGLTIANQKAIASLTTARPELSEVTRGASMGSAPLRCSPFLSYPAPLYLDDVIDTLGRINDLNDLKCLKTSEGTSTITTGGDEAVVRYLRRAEIEESIAALPPPQKQLVDSRSGQPLGLMTPIKADPPGALAVDAVWAALGGGSPYVSPQEVERCLARWRPDAATIAIDAFEASLLQGRAIILFGYVVLFGMEGLALWLLVAEPLMKTIMA